MPAAPRLLIDRLRHFCAYQERSKSEVEQKLYGERVPASEWPELIQTLEEEGYLDERRFAHAYARGKFRMKHWGRLLVRQYLRAKSIDEELIEEALEAEMPEDEYQAQLQRIIQKSLDKAEEANGEIDDREKAALMRKGYTWQEIDMAMRAIRDNQ